MVHIVSEQLWWAQTNTYVVSTAPGQPGVIIDAPPDPDGIIGLLDRYQIVPVAMLITHGHIDHVGGGGEIGDRLGLVGYLHPEDDFLSLDLETQYKFLIGSELPSEIRPPVRCLPLAHQQVIELAGISFTVRHTPGHTPGHCCFWLETEGVLFAGDQLFNAGIGRTDLPGGDAEQLFASMRDRVMDLDDEVRVLPGHGPETTIGAERHHNPFSAGWQ